MIRWMSHLLALMNTVSDLVHGGSPVSLPRVTQKWCSEEEALAPLFDGFAPLCILKEPTARMSVGCESRVKYLRVRMAISSLTGGSALPQLPTALLSTREHMDGTALMQIPNAPSAASSVCQD